MTRALTGIAAMACSLVFCASASAAKPRAYAFSIPSVSMSEVMTFQGDGGPACARSGVCGYSGTINYSFNAGYGLAGFIVSGRRVIGTADFFYQGLTSATVQGPGGGAPCTEKLIRDFDGFRAEGSPASMRLLFHPPDYAPDYLHTYCTGPGDLDMWDAHVLPEIHLSERALRHQRVHLRLSSTKPFHAGPFVGTLSFQVNMRLRRAKHVKPILQYLGVDL